MNSTRTFPCQSGGTITVSQTFAVDSVHSTVDSSGHVTDFSFSVMSKLHVDKLVNCSAAADQWYQARWVADASE